MFTVALIGPDGAGKTTVSRRLQTSLPFPVKSIYMGVNPDASDWLLPTTRVVNAVRRARGTSDGSDLSAAGDPNGGQRSGVGRSAASTVRSGVRLANWLAEEWFRQLVAWYYKRRGNLVLFDRHFFADYYMSDIANDVVETRSATRRIHGFLLERFYPRPDLVIFLDAPAEVLYERKPEGTVERLATRRLQYLQLAKYVPEFVVVDATRPLEDVIQQVREVICRFHDRHRSRVP